MRLRVGKLGFEMQHPRLHKHRHVSKEGVGDVQCCFGAFSGKLMRVMYQTPYGALHVCPTEHWRELVMSETWEEAVAICRR